LESCKIFYFKHFLCLWIDLQTNEIDTLSRQNKVKSLYVFGSVLTERFSEKSDIDLIVDIDSNDPFDYSENYFNLKFAL
jgi:predicted nucleotidyltransferase